MNRTRSKPHTTTARPAGVAGRLGASLFFAAWLIIPTIILGAVVRQGWSTVRTWSWTPAECTILESGVGEAGSDLDYVFTVRYQYAVPGASAVEAPPRVGTVFSPGYRGDDDYAPAQRLVLRYPPGSRATCYVNPDDPGDAVLRRGSAWVLAVTPFPLLFVAIGVGGLYFTWRAAAAPKPTEAGPISAGAGRPGIAAGQGPAFLVVFFSIFLLVGLVVLYFFGSKAAGAMSARSWGAVPARVVSSGVRTHSGEDTTYSVNVLYAYTVGGREYRANRYHFMGGSGGGYEGKRDIVGQYPPGRTFTAYVNPADPTDAVIERGPTADMWLLLLPLVFAAVGGVGVFYSARAGLRARGSRPPAPIASAGTGGDFSGRYSAPARPARPGSATLKPTQSVAARVLGLTVFAVFWNGIISVFLYHVVKSWSSGRGEACMTVFLVPFVLVGVGVLFAAAHAFLALFNPRCALTLDPAEPSLGEMAEVRWTFTGRYDRIGRLVIRVKAREEATYRQGTNTTTDKNEFLTIDLVDTTRAVDFHAGKARFTVPADTMHSFNASNNRVVWHLAVHAHIAGRPDVKEEYPLVVHPLPPAAVRATAGRDEADEPASDDKQAPEAS